MPKDEINVVTAEQINAIEGKIVGLTAILASILKNNPQITVDENDVERIIFKTMVVVNTNDVETLKNKAREAMHWVSLYSQRKSF
jgi:hypothetical protein